MTKQRFDDQHTPSYGSYVEGDLIAHEKSEWQDIKIVQTETHGRVMLIDDVLMLSEDTHHVYHEHMVHLPLACIEAPKSVLVIGGGDGGTVNELVKYDGIERIVLAELDGVVVKMSEDYLPELTTGLKDPRVEIRIGDGAAYLAEQEQAFDAIIIDSTDVCDEAVSEVDNANPLISDEFYRNIKKAIRPGGVTCQMIGSPTFYTGGVRMMYHKLGGKFAHFKPFLMPTPFYISGDWGGGIFSDDNPLIPKFEHVSAEKLVYFNSDIATGALALPNSVRKLMK
ncbi:MAG: hypothetical protein CMK09_14290 [Ponticaulis sp.]|nr:hypothetical protein [Ponticaulis sp.]|tara:strand:- start:67307 stop:68152 length:846 start_codon:yes stop_codon:yes gene_type:complete